MGTPQAVPGSVRDEPNGSARDGWVNPRRLWSILAEPLLVFASNRAALLMLSYFAEYLLPRVDGRGSYAGEPFLMRWARWDGGYYLRIAAEGYVAAPDGNLPSVVFFPLYPILVRLVSQLTGDLLTSSWLVANFSMLLALIGLYALTTRLCDRLVARRTILLLTFAPFSLFYAASYTESIFLLLAVASFLFAERGSWWKAGLVGALCSATRLVGLALGPTLLLLYFQRRDWRWRTLAVGNLAAPMLVVLGTGLYAAYLWYSVGNPLAFVSASLNIWQRHNLFVNGPLPTANLADYGGYYAYLWVHLLSGVPFLILAVPVARLLGPAYALFVALGVLIPMSAGIDSLGRYVIVLFPAFIALAHHLRSRVVFTAVLVAFALGQGLFTLLFVNWYPLN
jgi:hypothetical protein